jgi:hypothetical protein
MDSSGFFETDSEGTEIGQSIDGDAPTIQKIEHPNKFMNMSKWPLDADGDVFRNLEAKGFDFSKVYSLDFNVDFDQWPPPAEAIEVIEKSFPDTEVHQDSDNGGYLLFHVSAKLTYDLVMAIQEQASALAAPYGGRCDSWGLLH